MTSIIDLENSNLPIDYFTSVLPRAQYGDESAVPVGLNNADATFIVKDAADPSKGVLFGSTSYGVNDSLQRVNASPTPSHGSYASQITTSLPYISYVDLAAWLNDIYQHSLSAFAAYFSATPNVAARSIALFKQWCDKSSAYSDVFVCDSYRLYRDWETDRKSTRLNSSHITRPLMPSSA